MIKSAVPSPPCRRSSAVDCRAPVQPNQGIGRDRPATGR
jgi:hypothetical protein